jgi:hypothetical protein
MIGIKYMDLLSSGYEIKFHFVVIDRAFQTYSFPVTEHTLNTWLDRMNKVLEAADWHYTNKRYDLPYSFATGSVVL